MLHSHRRRKHISAKTHGLDQLRLRGVGLYLLADPEGMRRRRCARSALRGRRETISRKLFARQHPAGVAAECSENIELRGREENPRAVRVVELAFGAIDPPPRKLAGFRFTRRDPAGLLCARRSSARDARDQLSQD